MLQRLKDLDDDVINSSILYIYFSTTAILNPQCARNRTSKALDHFKAIFSLKQQLFALISHFLIKYTRQLERCCVIRWDATNTPFRDVNFCRKLVFLFRVRRPRPCAMTHILRLFSTSPQRSCVYSTSYSRVLLVEFTLWKHELAKKWVDQTTQLTNEWKSTLPCRSHNLNIFLIFVRCCFLCWKILSSTRQSLRLRLGSLRRNVSSLDEVV